MIGVIVPAHDEEDRLPRCLASIALAAVHPALGGEPVRVMVVLDACSDGSAAAVAEASMNQAGSTGVAISSLAVSLRNVGAARAAGAQALIGQGARWLAFTDADTEVSPDWLAVQVGLGADAVCGTVGVAEWHTHEPAVRQRYASCYVDADGHRHVHGANLGVATEWYLRAGGFAPLAAHEDVALVQALADAGATIAWSAAPRVTTSARRDARARGGFGDYLLALAAAGAAGAAGGVAAGVAAAPAAG